MKINYYLLTIFLSTTKLKTNKQQKQPPHNNRLKQLLLKASSYLSIGHSKVASCEGRDSNSIFFQVNIIQHENYQAESQDADSISQPDH